MIKRLHVYKYVYVQLQGGRRLQRKDKTQTDIFHPLVCVSDIYLQVSEIMVEDYGECKKINDKG